MASINTSIQAKATYSYTLVKETPLNAIPQNRRADEMTIELFNASPLFQRTCKVFLLSMKRNNIRLPKDLLFKILGSMHDAYADALPRAKKIFNCDFEKEFGDTPEAQLVTIGKYGISLSKVESYLKKIKMNRLPQGMREVDENISKAVVKQPCFIDPLSTPMLTIPKALLRLEDLKNLDFACSTVLYLPPFLSQMPRLCSLTLCADELDHHAIDILKACTSLKRLICVERALYPANGIRNLDLKGFFDETYLFNSVDEVISFLDQTGIKVFSCPSYWISENQEMHNTAMCELSTTNPLGVEVGDWCVSIEEDYFHFTKTNVQ